MEVCFLFNCIDADYKELKIIEAYEEDWFALKTATAEQKQAIIHSGAFSHQALFKDPYITVKQFSHGTKQLLCVKWSRIHFFYEIL